MKRLTKLFFIPLLLVGICVPSFSATVSAQSSYGRDTYGVCTYGPCGTHTTVNTPSGLEVAINLTEGQVIPRSGYTVTITPLNGAGSSFQKALIYIDGVLVATVTPGPNGTATWFWDTSTFPGEKITFEIIDNTGKQTDQAFTVKIAAPEEVPTTGDGSSTAGGGDETKSTLQKLFSPLTTAFANLSQTMESLIRKLPAPVVYVFPYLLFILLVLQVIILLLQAKRELRAIKALEVIAAKQKEIAEMKQTFMSLLEHYLRTPFTILQSGTEMLKGQDIAATTITAIQTHTQALKQIIESTVQMTDDQQIVAGGGNVLVHKLTLRKVLTYTLLGLSLFLLVFVAFWFVYLANKVTNYDTGTIGIIVQFVLFSIVVVSTFQIFRRLQLHKSERRAREILQEQTAALQAAKDSAIQDVATRYAAELGALQGAVSQLPVNNSTKFVGRGLMQLVDVQQRFVAVTLLRGGASTAAPQQIEFRALCSSVIEKLDEKIKAKNIDVRVDNNALFTCKEPALLATVLQSLIDNAIGYSPPDSSVSVLVDDTPEGTRITVADTGRGIPAEAQGKVFQAFYKSEGADDFTHEGMGFSLYLDRLIMEHLGGTISLDSEAGKGTKAFVHLPTHS